MELVFQEIMELLFLLNQLLLLSPDKFQAHVLLLRDMEQCKMLEWANQLWSNNLLLQLQINNIMLPQPQHTKLIISNQSLNLLMFIPNKKLKAIGVVQFVGDF